ncbi:vitamin B6 photo-protection and homoeostasis-domain-containing protein [Hypoxylon trugodes]|uniref:vitamin B6 photo-protection and homoeostasis-domain-containing protein n=1 Tax=Hypoxylon trugodes TaxID=326681 RepID=UPI0021936417|nr:vitamin B6 photo-protection and homoeostasis-domain-containing protein [Hypoxylon trugodes]KAI1388989.1 vitamin B6 photo-protection and homoeostasis-domain-containing protein [Hypoxylon trugodes]
MAPQKDGEMPSYVYAIEESGALRVYTTDGKDVAYLKHPRGYVKAVMDVFLPAGYPNSVTPDYTPYQIYDSLQAFSSTIAGLLSSRAVLQGFGVGDSTSSATAAVLLTVLQESTGRLATIWFAHRCGRAIAPECKYYRFLADIVNDLALLFDVLSPALPPPQKVAALCTAGILRALCGVSGGASKAALSAHFAKTGNLAELNAKDGSQETVISLFGMLIGSLFLQVVHGKAAVWFWMVTLVSVHLWTNYQAVRAVQMRTLNKQRLCMVIDKLKHRVLRPDQVAAEERIITWTKPNITFVDTVPTPLEIQRLNFEKYVKVGYLFLILPDEIKIYMKEGYSTRDVLRAYIEAYHIVHTRYEFSTGQPIDEYYDELWKSLKAAGWDLETNAIETGPSIQLRLTHQKD